MVYMIMDFENQQQSIANANQAAQISGDAIPICGSSSSDGGSSNNTGAIAGGVVGGIAGLALLAILAWFLWRRKKRSAMAGSATGAAKVEDPSAVNGVNLMDKAELPQYSAVDHISPSKTDSGSSLPVQELPAQNPTSEMPDTQRAPLGELPATEGHVARSELPA